MRHFLSGTKIMQIIIIIACMIFVGMFCVWYRNDQEVGQVVAQTIDQDLQEEVQQEELKPEEEKKRIEEADLIIPANEKEGEADVAIDKIAQEDADLQEMELKDDESTGENAGLESPKAEQKSQGNASVSGTVGSTQSSNSGVSSSGSVQSSVSNSSGSAQPSVPSSSSSGSSGSNAAESKPSHTHTWKDNYKTVFHDAEYETWYEDVYDDVELSICNQCGEDITGNTTAHLKANMETCSGYHSEWRKVFAGTIPHTEIVKDAWTEEVKDGEICNGCGARK